MVSYMSSITLLPKSYQHQARERERDGDQIAAPVQRDREERTGTDQTSR